MRALGSIGLYLWLTVFALKAANPDLLTRPWSAHWISAAGASPYDYGVYHFRRTLKLAAAPQSFLIHLTADNRYKLYVNGEMVSFGPARGDLYHWRYESRRHCAISQARKECARRPRLEFRHARRGSPNHQ